MLGKRGIVCCGTCCILLFCIMCAGAFGQSTTPTATTLTETQHVLIEQQVRMTEPSQKTNATGDRIIRRDCLPPDANGISVCTQKEITRD